jgi:hypothetical protein
MIEDFLHLSQVSLTSVANLELWISPRIFEKIRNDPNGILRAWGKLIHEKNQKSKISWHCPCKDSKYTVYAFFPCTVCALHLHCAVTRIQYHECLVKIMVKVMSTSVLQFGQLVNRLVGIVQYGIYYVFEKCFSFVLYCKKKRTLESLQIIRQSIKRKNRISCAKLNFLLLIARVREFRSLKHVNFLHNFHF